MSSNSLFEKHWQIISDDPEKWSDSVTAEYKNLQRVALPALPALPERSSLWERLRPQLNPSLMVALSLSIFLVILIPRLLNHQVTGINENSGWNVKGATKISVYWERTGKVTPFNSDQSLVDGDRVGASLLTDRTSYAYWAVADRELNLLSSTDDIKTSQLLLEPGKQAQFSSSFELVSPNQGEVLLIWVCPISSKSASVEVAQKKLTRELISTVIQSRPSDFDDCVIAGYKLRGN